MKATIFIPLLCLSLGLISSQLSASTQSLDDSDFYAPIDQQVQWGVSANQQYNTYAASDVESKSVALVHH